MLINDEVGTILPTFSTAMPRSSNLAEMLQQMYVGDRVKSKEGPQNLKTLLLTDTEPSL